MSLLTAVVLCIDGDIRLSAAPHPLLPAPRRSAVISGVTLGLDETNASSVRLRFEVCGPDVTQIPGTGLDEAARSPVPFIVLGDFNRRFNLPNDQVWMELDDGDPPNADLTTVTKDMPVSCRDNQFTEFIDHIVFDRRAVQWVDRTSFRQITYRQEDKAVWDKISDHCPVMVELWIR